MNVFQQIYNPKRNEIRKQYLLSTSRNLPSKPNHSYIYKFLPGESVVFGNFFNSLFEDEVNTVTGINTLYLNLTIKGNCHLNIYRIIPEIGESILNSIEIETASEFAEQSIEVPLISGNSSRIYFEIIDNIGGAILEQAYWGTTKEIKNDVRLCVTTTTFKNEELIDDNIKYLLESEEIKQLPIEVAVVDNASSYTPKIEDNRLHLFPQGNVGGAGGFTRGIYEVVYGKLKENEFTHILLMDDDIKLHLGSIIRIVRMYQYQVESTKVALGGCMLDLNRPNFLFESGAFAMRQMPISSHNDVDYNNASNFHNLDSLGSTTEYDYCGWWFFSFPITAVKEIGLPKPVFIRGDDVDYGERLTQAGYKNYCLGGVGVWHLHFSEKPISWVVYYVFRNHLIMLATSYKNRGWKTKRIIRQLRNTIRHNICQFDYAHAALVILAIEDFLKGPDFLKKEKSSNILLKVLETYKKYNSKLDPEEIKLIGSTKGLPDNKRNNYMKKITLNYQITPLKKQTTEGFEIFYGDQLPLWKQAPLTNGYLVHDKTRNVKRVFERRENLAKELNQQASTMISKIIDNYDNIAQQYENKCDELHSKEYWEDYLTNNNCM